MEKLTNWAYGFKLNHEGAGVGTIYYVEKYFDKEGIVNPASAKPYTIDELSEIKNNAVKGNEVYIDNVPECATIGMNPLNTDKIFWYDEENGNKILKSSNPLGLDAENGEMKDMEGNVVAKAM